VAAGLTDGIWSVAEAFIEQVHGATGMAAIVCDGEGIIRKAYDRSRVGNPHAGSQAILRGTQKEFVVTAEQVKRNPLIKTGCSVAIEVGGKKVGTFGITGKPEIATPVARVSSVLLGSFIRQFEVQAFLRDTSHRIFEDVDRLVDQSRSEASKLRSIYQTMAEAAQEASGRATASNGILKTVSRIADQSHILSLNGSIEAARAGMVGRAFGAVVDEMAQLSKDTVGAVSSVQVSIEEICGSIRHLDVAIRESSAVSRESVQMIDGIPALMGQLKETIARLEAALHNLMR
jgi:hypothetical protein